MIIIDGEGRRTAESYNGIAALAPKLCVEFTPILTLWEGAGNDTATSQSFKSSATIYPNPASDHVSISFESNVEENIPLHIRDLGGRIVYSDRQDIYKGDNTLFINGLDLPEGVYFIRLQINGMIQTLKFAVLK